MAIISVNYIEAVKSNEICTGFETSAVEGGGMDGRAQAQNERRIKGKEH